MLMLITMTFMVRMLIMIPMIHHLLLRLILSHLLRSPIKNNMLLNPIHNRLPLTTLMQGIKARTLTIESLRIIPDEIRRHISRTHEVHPERLDAVVDVPADHVWSSTPGRIVGVVPFVFVGVLSDQVQAMDLVESFQETGCWAVGLSGMNATPVNVA